ncbi:hypothetical protein ACFX1X_018719 [Malus domestica]
MVGAPQYLTFTCQDIAFSVNQVFQFMHKPTTTHWIVVKRIIRYLKSTPDHDLVYKLCPLTFTAFDDSDYAGDPDDRISIGGYCIFLVLILCPGIPRNKEAFLVLALSPSIINLPLLPPQFHGFESYSMTSISSLLLQRYGVTIFMRSPWLPTRFSIHRHAVLKWTTIIFKIR